VIGGPGKDIIWGPIEKYIIIIFFAGEGGKHWVKQLKEG